MLAYTVAPEPRKRSARAVARRAATVLGALRLRLSRQSASAVSPAALRSADLLWIEQDHVGDHPGGDAAPLV